MLEVVVVSPQKPVFKGQVDSVIIESVEGSMGIKAKHADIVAALGAGPMRIGDEVFAVWGGFVKVGGNRVTVLVDQAIAVEDIDGEAARAELAEVSAALAHPKSDQEFEELLMRRRWCETRLRLAS